MIIRFFFLIRRLPPGPTRALSRVPYTTVFRSAVPVRTWLFLDTRPEPRGEAVVQQLAELLLEVGFGVVCRRLLFRDSPGHLLRRFALRGAAEQDGDRKSTRLNSSH